MRSGFVRKVAGTSVLACIVTAMTVVVGIPPPAAADGGDFSLDFIAAEPQSYSHALGGGAYDDRTIGTDVVESLEGGDFRCFDVVTYLVSIETAASPTHENQSIEIDFSFLADTTGQSGVAHVDVLRATMNYGSVVAGDGPGGTDLGVQDDTGSRAALLSEGFVGVPFTPGAELLATVGVDDLEAGERTVLRVDVELGCMPGRPTGNLQAALTAARVVSPAGDAIGVGEQTIPFKMVSEIIRSTITVKKDADPATSQFAFTISGPSQMIGQEPFSDTQWVSGDMGEFWWPSLAAGTYTLSELVPVGWSLEGISCEAGTWSAESGAATIWLPERTSIDVVCTFVDKQTQSSTTTTTTTTPPPTTPGVTGEIGDRVWADVDADGIQEIGEVGVGKVDVKLLKGGQVIAGTQTNEAGLYLFGGLAAGEYEVQFVLPDGFEFTPLNAPDNDAVDSDADPVTGRTGPIVLSAGEKDHTWDAGIIRPPQVLPQVVTTSTNAVETLPFTGPPDVPGLVGLATAIAAMGGMAVLSITRKEDQPMSGWSRRLP